MRSQFVNEAIKHLSPKSRDEIDKIPENMFHHNDLDADIKELEEKIKENKQ